jgi:hypothetical protein
MQHVRRLDPAMRISNVEDWVVLRRYLKTWPHS